MDIKSAKRLQLLPPYLFAEIDRKKREAVASGKDVIDLGVGDPDVPTPDFIVEEAKAALCRPENHRYSLDQGKPALREAFAAWAKKRYGVELDAQEEILPLIGSKEGIAHLPLALVDPGEVVLVPEPCYPPYRSGSLFAGAEVFHMPLKEENGFLPDLEAIPADVLQRTRLMFLNYPNNPTAALAKREFLEKAVAFAREHNIIIGYDAAYIEMVYEEDGRNSILTVPGAKECCIEFHSLSKTFNMTGWRIGFAIGGAHLVRLLGKVKANIDSGIFGAVQDAGTKALSEEGERFVERMREVYRKRMEIMVEGLRKAGLDARPSQATFYLWTRVPEGYTSGSFCEKILEEADIVVTPGAGFGPSGEGFFRVALTVSEERLSEAAERLSKVAL